ncbi:butyrophilin-like protein 2 [Colossoma macropomum]|uniref:butyrophilin-like protein 2 n=1 Tax=Colossoma macropomum TaxID=42526 RepID=UPI001864B79D|nr:butyrophilin-like protein 2 [Colossoma macropomum]
MIRLLLLLASALWPMTSGGTAVHEVRGQVGGAVRLTCRIDNSLPVKAVFFQKKNLSGVYDILVNGFYIHTVTGFLLDEYRNRTRVNRAERSLDFWDLKASDEGYYKCFFIRQDTLRSYDTTFRLTITADYSVPTVTVQECSDRGEGALSCELGCSSFGGYPLANLSWTVSKGGNEVLLQEGGSVNTADKHSGVWNVSQTIRLNCTQPTNVSCSVGGVVSPPLSICGTAVHEVRGHVGGAVRLTCRIDNSLPVKGVFFQKKNLSGVYDILVNGFYSHIVTGFLLDEYRNRTRVNRAERSLDFWDLKASDEGYYKCFFIPQDTLRSYDTTFRLTITADYSVPTVTVQECSDRGEGALSCELGCSSFGGYPLANLSWTVSKGGNEVLLQEGGSVNTADKHSGVWNVSQTIRLNCTQPTNVSCSVGGVVSPPLSICERLWAKHTEKTFFMKEVADTES